MLFINLTKIEEISINLNQKCQLTKIQLIAVNKKINRFLYKIPNRYLIQTKSYEN